MKNPLITITGVCEREEFETLNKLGGGPWVFNRTREETLYSTLCTGGALTRPCLKSGVWGDLDYSNCTLIFEIAHRAIDSLVCLSHELSFRDCSPCY